MWPNQAHFLYKSDPDSGIHIIVHEMCDWSKKNIFLFLMFYQTQIIFDNLLNPDTFLEKSDPGDPVTQLPR